MVGFGNNPFPRMESTLSFGGRGDSQIAHADISPTTVVVKRGWVWHLKREGDQQIKLFVVLIVPETPSPNLGPLLDQI